MPVRKSPDTILKMAKKFDSYAKFKEAHPHEAYELKKSGRHLAPFRKINPVKVATRKKSKEILADEIRALAVNFKTKISFYSAHRKEYHQAKYIGIFDEITAHMIRVYPNTFGTEDQIADRCKSYRTMAELHKDQPLFRYLTRNNRIEELCSHMPDRNHLYFSK